MPFKVYWGSLLKDIPFICFFVSIVLYALWGSPTPDKPGVIEALIALCLFLSIGGVSGVNRIFHSLHSQSTMMQYAVFFLAFMALIPLIVSLFSPYSLTAIIRDVLGLVLISLPVFLASFFLRQNQRGHYFLYLLMALALIFSIRVLFPYYSLFVQNDTELLYLANSPIVLFFLLYLPMVAFKEFYNNLTLKQLLMTLLLLFVSSLMIVAVVQDAQRAPIFLLCLSALGLSILALIRSPRRSLYCTVFLAVPIAVCVWPYAHNVLGDLIAKTLHVGGNMRFEEITAIWQIVSDDPWSALFGLGWGSSYASPAVGNLYVTYSHSLLSYMFLKSGFLGLVVTLVYVFFILKMIWSIGRTDLILAQALLGAFIIPVFLYASHKSFDFGLLLTLIFVSYEQKKAVIQKYEKTIHSTD